MCDGLIQHVQTRRSRIHSFSFIVAVALGVGVSLVFFLLPFFSPDCQSAIDLDSRINPNQASTASLARLPGIGVSLADAIISYREDFRERIGGGIAFRSCDDLQKVRGIGPKKTKSMSKWLKFE